MKTYWLRINCEWHRVTTDLATWAAIPRATLIAGGCAVFIGSAAVAGIYTAHERHMADETAMRADTAALVQADIGRIEAEYPLRDEEWRTDSGRPISVPEPESWVIFGVALVMLACVGWVL